MDPAERLTAAHDAAIQACEERNARRAGDAVLDLVTMLDFSRAGQGLVVLYDWIYRRIKEGELDEAMRFLLELRETRAER